MKMTRALIVCAALLVAAWPATAKDILYVNSFENCSPDGIPENLWYQFRPLTANAHRVAGDCVAVENQPVDGKKSLQLKVHRRGDMALVGTSLTSGRWADKIMTEPGKTYSFSVYAKADREGVPVELVQWSGGKRKTFSVGTQWERLVFNFVPDRASDSWAIIVKEPEATVWLDAVQIEEGEATAFSPNAKTLDPRCHLDADAGGIPPENPRYTVAKIDKAPVIDGNFYDECWKNVPSYTFDSLKDGKKAATDFKLATDGYYFYLAVTCHEPQMGKIIAKQTEHDSEVYTDDCLELFMQSVLNSARYDHYMVNSLGTRAEEICGGGGWGMDFWWNAKTSKGKDFWNAEIMFHVPRDSSGDAPDAPLLFNLCRSRSGAGEHLPWSGKYHRPLTWPVLTGVRRPTPLARESALTFRLGAADGELLTTHRIKNLSGKDLEIEAELLVQRGGAEEKVAGTAVALARGSSKEISFAVPVKPGEGAFTVSLLVRAKGERHSQCGDPHRVDLSDLVKGPVLRHNIYVPDDQKLEYRVDLSAFVALKGGKAIFSVEDLFGRKLWESQVPLADTVRGAAPLAKLDFGDLVFRTRVLVDKKVIADTRMFFRHVERKDGEVVVRADRFKRVLTLDGKPLYGVMTGFSAINALLPDAGDVMADLRGHGVKFLRLACKNSATSPMASSETVKSALDLAEKHGLKAVLAADFFHSPVMDELELLRFHSHLRQFKRHPALLAYRMLDEPSPAIMPKMSGVIPLLQDLDPFHPVSININHGAMHIKPWRPYMGSFVSTDCYSREAGAVYHDSKAVREAAPWDALLYWIESYSSGRRAPSPQEFVYMSYEAIVNGSSIISAFIYKPASLELWDSWKTLADEMETLQDALMAEDFTDFTASDGQVAASLRKTGKGDYLICVTLTDETVRTRLDAPGFAGVDAKVEVLFENREVQMKGGVIEDEFLPFARHVYLIKK